MMFDVRNLEISGDFIAYVCLPSMTLTTKVNTCDSPNCYPKLGCTSIELPTNTPDLRDCESACGSTFDYTRRTPSSHQGHPCESFLTALRLVTCSISLAHLFQFLVVVNATKNDIEPPVEPIPTTMSDSNHEIHASTTLTLKAEARSSECTLRSPQLRP